MRRGEVLGLAGLVGAGRTEVARAIFGADPLDTGESARRQARAPVAQDAIDAASAWCRRTASAGLVLEHGGPRNITLANLDASARRLHHQRERSARAERVRARPSGPHAVHRADGSAISPAATSRRWCSAKWLFTDAEVLIFDEPTRGIDVGAKVEIYAVDERARGRGASAS